MDIAVNEYAAKLASFEAHSYNELVEAMIVAQEKHAYMKAETGKAWDEVCFIARTVIPTRMDKDQIQNITVILPDGSKKQLLVLSQVSVKTPPENKLALWEWLRKHDAAELITETVNSSTLAAYVRGQMQEGEPYPNDLLIVSAYDTASLRKA